MANTTNSRDSKSATPETAPMPGNTPKDMPNPYGLAPRELALALFLAVRSMCGYSYSLPTTDIDFTGQFSVPRADVPALVDALYSKGLIENSRWRDQSVKPNYILPLVQFVIEHYPKLAEKVKTLFSRWTGGSRIFELLEWATDPSKPNPKDSLYIPGELSNMIMSLPFNEPWMLRLLSFIDENDALSFTLAYVNGVELEQPGYTIAALKEVIKNFSLEPRKLNAIIDAVEYLQLVINGVPPTLPANGKVPSTRPFLQVSAAIMLCGQGKYAEAADFMNKAAKRLGYDNMALTPGLLYGSYYHAVALYALCRNEELAPMARNTQIAVLRPSTVIASAANSDVTTPSRNLMADLKDSPESPLKALYALFCDYFMKDKLQELPPVSAMALQSEMRQMLALPADRLALIDSVFGPNPGLASIKILAKWEKRVNELMGALDEAIVKSELDVSKKSEPDTIYYYVVDKYSRKVRVKKRTLLKSGNWSVLKSVSISTFVDLGNELTDKYDTAMCALAASTYREESRYYYSSDMWPHLADAAPLLVGCDRVLEEANGSELVPLTVTKQKTKVTIAERRGQLKVDCNISATDLASTEDYIVQRPSGSNNIVVTELNPNFNRVLLKLVQAGSFPLDARDAITVLLAKMSEYVEVESPLLDSSTIPNYEGDSTVIVQLKPIAGGQYSALMFVRPYPQSRHRHLPGKGKEQYIALYDGRSTRIQRDLVAEARNFDALAEALTDTEADIDFAEADAVLDIDSVLTLLEWAKTNADKVAVEWPEKNGLRLQRLVPSSWNVGLKSNNGWFDIEGDVKLDDATVLSMADLLQSIGRSSGRFIRLDDGKFLEIDKKLRSQLARLESLAVKNRGKMQISQFNAALVDQNLAEGEMHMDFDDRLLQLRERVEKAAKYEHAVPATLNATLRPYQEDGFRWMARLAAWGAGACLADDMGLGKTVQTIAFMLLKAEEGPALVVAPASVVPNWAGELERFAPTLNVTIVNQAADRAAAIKEAKPYDVVLITYGLLYPELEALTSLKWATVCLDEAHTIKNRETKMSQAAMELKADYRIILTGTPLQNNLSELWNLFRFINPGLLGSYESFREKFVRPIAEDGDRERRHALQRIIKPFMLRRTKTDVASDLPEKTEVYIPIELSAEENALYEALRAQAASALEDKEKVDVSALAEISRLRRAACCMQLVDPQWHGPDSKVQAFLDLVADCQGADNNMLVFSQYTSFLEIVRKALDKAGIPYLYLDGSTPMAKREQLVKDFNTGKTPLFLISLKAGGLGLNLPAANYVVHLDPWWNPAIEQQATDRAYRIGQKRKVMVYHMISKGTIEEKIRRLHDTKRNMADSLLEGTDMAAKLTMKDILDLISQN